MSEGPCYLCILLLVDYFLTCPPLVQWRGAAYGRGPQSHS